MPPSEFVDWTRSEHHLDDGIKLIPLSTNHTHGLINAFTNDPKIIDNLRSEIQAGLLAVNSTVVSTPETPFGGIKHSGYGSEGGIEGLDAFLVTRFISETYNI